MAEKVKIYAIEADDESAKLEYIPCRIDPTRDWFSIEKAKDPIHVVAIDDDIELMKDHLQRDKEKVLSKETLDFAIANGNFGMVQFLCENGAKISEDAIYLSIYCNHVRMMRYLDSRGAPKPPYAVDLAIWLRFQKFLVALLEHGHKISAYTPAIVLAKGTPHTIETLYSYRCRFDDAKALDAHARYPALDRPIELALGRVSFDDMSHDDIPADQIPFGAVRYGIKYDFLDDLCTRGCVISDTALKIAIFQNSPMAVKRLFESRKQFPLWLLEYAREKMPAIADWAKVHGVKFV